MDIATCRDGCLNHQPRVSPQGASSGMPTVLRNGSNQMGWQNFTQEIIIGIVIIMAVGLDMLRQSRTRR